MFTANSMNCLCEALGHGPARQRHDPGDLRRPQGPLPTRRRNGSWRWPGSSARIGPGHGLLPREIATQAAFDNAMILDMAMGGSTNTVLHILAIAHEAEVPYTMAPDQRTEPQDAEHLQGRPLRQVPRRGRGPRRGHPHDPGRGRPRAARPDRPLLSDRHGEDPRREHRRTTTCAAQAPTTEARLLTRVRAGGVRTSRGLDRAERRRGRLGEPGTGRRRPRSRDEGSQRRTDGRAGPSRLRTARGRVRPLRRDPHRRERLLAGRAA